MTEPRAGRSAEHLGGGDDDLRWADLGDEPSLGTSADAIERDVPVFLAELTRRHRDRLARLEPATCWVVSEGDLPVAVVRAAPLSWDGTPAGAPGGGLGEAVHRVGQRHADGVVPPASQTDDPAAGDPAAGDPEAADTLMVLDVTVAFGARGRGIGTRVLAGLDVRRRELGLDRTLVLLRPHAKADYPLIPFARYASFVRGDGQPVDPWFRAAWRVGLRPVRGVERSLVAQAPLDDWRRWVGVEVPGSGPYLVDGAIKPAILEVELDEGRYREPHLWVGSDDGSDDGADEGGPGGRTPEGWVDALRRAGVVAGDRAHRERRR